MNRKEIRKWMIDADMTLSQIAKEMGVCDSLVSLMLSGQRKRQAGRMAEILRKHGCPAEHLEQVNGATDKAA